MKVVGNGIVSISGYGESLACKMLHVHEIRRSLEEPKLPHNLANFNAEVVVEDIARRAIKVSICWSDEKRSVINRLLTRRIDDSEREILTTDRPSVDMITIDKNVEIVTNHLKPSYYKLTFESVSLAQTKACVGTSYP
ncbi:jg24309 [Pararge aegeria aegeria]|uniref:Jg24309 protein n=1 Tax=Pararge aegeria aegeria TaxID=348720 RepID=A0A8S4SEQ1_9NEOP|nr:jg24309 [Pararge aegeria aegeria]